MLKGIFMDFYGTVAQEISPVAVAVIQDIYTNSNAKSMEEVTGYWWKVFRKKLEAANGEHFKTQHDVALESFRDLICHFDCRDTAKHLLERMEEHWCTTPVYKDAEEFLQAAPLPVYFVTNSDDKYIYTEIEKHHLNPQGVITSEQAKYAKPRKEIFRFALEKLHLKPEEVIHIGDSLDGDVRCPQAVGIQSIWLNRENKPVPEGVASVTDLREVPACLQKMGLI